MELWPRYDAFRSDISPKKIFQDLQSDISLIDYIGNSLLIVFLLGTCMALSGGMATEISDQIRLYGRILNKYDLQLLPPEAALLLWISILKLSSKLLLTVITPHQETAIRNRDPNERLKAILKNENLEKIVCISIDCFSVS